MNVLPTLQSADETFLSLTSTDNGTRKPSRKEKLIGPCDIQANWTSRWVDFFFRVQLSPFILYSLSLSRPRRKKTLIGSRAIRCNSGKRFIVKLFLPLAQKLSNGSLSLISRQTFIRIKKRCLQLYNRHLMRPPPRQYPSFVSSEIKLEIYSISNMNSLHLIFEEKSRT